MVDSQSPGCILGAETAGGKAASSGVGLGKVFAGISGLRWRLVRAPVAARITKMSTPALEKAAGSLFKAVCDCMGEDGKGGVHPELRTSRSLVVSMAGEHPELIAEVYCQLVRQTSGNPNPLSERRGWQLLAACAAQYLPGEALCECVCCHANRNRFRGDAIGGLAFFV